MQRRAPVRRGSLLPEGRAGKKAGSTCWERPVNRCPLISPVLAGKDGLEFRDTQQVGVRGDYEVGMFGQSGGQVETIIVNESIFL